MYIRPITITKNGKRHGYWALVESCRTPCGPRQRVVSYLGQMEESFRGGVHQKASGQDHQRMLFGDVEPAWVEVNVNEIRVENCQDFGGPWVGLELLKKLGLTDLFERLMPAGRESVPWSLMAMVLIIARLCDPSSELQIAEHFYKDTALCDLLGVRIDQINEDRLYRALDQLLPHKEQLETHLKERMGRLFNLEYDILLYDVTSTYFEGQALGNPLARRGYSRDHRPDCKQVCIGLVVSQCGMPLGYELFAGIRNWSSEDLWKAYIQLTEAEAAFRIQKSDLKIRPIWHHKKERVQAHILVCFMAYVLWKTLAQMCKTAGLGDEPRRVFAELGKIRVVDVVLPTRSGHTIRRRCVSRPSDHQAILLQRLGLNLPKNLPLAGTFLKEM